MLTLPNVLVVFGPDALSFLQRMATQDLRTTPCKTLFLHPNGHVLFACDVWHHENAFFLHAAEVEGLKRWLQRYKLSANVHFERRAVPFSPLEESGEPVCETKGCFVGKEAFRFARSEKSNPHAGPCPPASC